MIYFAALIALSSVSALSARLLDSVTMHSDPVRCKAPVQDVTQATGVRAKTELLNMLDASEPLASPIMGSYEYEESEYASLVNMYDHTLTVAGSWALSRYSMPVVDQHDLSRRQEIIRSLLAHDNVALQLSNALSVIAANQESLYAYFNKEHALHERAKAIYFKLFDSVLNHNEMALESAFWVDCGKTVMALFAHLGFEGIVHNLFLQHDAVFVERFKQTVLDEKIPEKTFSKRELKQLWNAAHPDQGKSSWRQGVTMGLLKPLRVHDPRFSLLKDPLARKEILSKPSSHIINILMGDSSAGDLYTIITEGFSLPKPVAFGAVGLIALIRDISLGVNIKNGYDHLKVVWETAGSLEHELIALGSLFQACHDLVDACAHCPELANTEAIRTLAMLRTGGEFVSTRLRQVVLLTQRLAEFHHAGSLAQLSRGKVLLAHKLLTEVSHELVPIIKAIGSVDAWCSIRSVYIKQTEQTPWCMPQFSSAERPFIRALSSWCPLVTTNVVHNDIIIGNAGPGNLIITGPNGGGKSTFMKSAMYHVLLGQSWGIVPSACAEFTPFTNVMTALRPHEDTTRGISTFMSERLRLDKMKSTLTVSTDKDYIFMVLDEPCRGTVEGTAQELVYAFGSELAQSDRVCSIIATHFEKPTLLEKDYPGAVANYLCEFVDDGDHLRRTFRVLPGIAHWWFHDETMRSKYLATLEIPIGS